MKKSFISKQRIVCFRQYSRKKFAAFSSLGKIIKISTLGAACSLIVSPVLGQSKGETDSISKKLELEEVEVIGQKSTLLVDEIPRMVELIQAEVILKSPSQSFVDLLGYHSNIDIRQRGPFGTQADVSIRGGSFDNTLILLNGTNLTDPQTGHHSLNLPIDQETINKIEVLNGPSARAIGANAYSGAINVITKPYDKNKISASLHFGEHNYMREHISLNIARNKSKHLITAGNAQSDGYMRDTDFKNYHLFYHGVFTHKESMNSFLQMGYSQKSFGANSYYSAKYPDQFENNKNIFFNAGINTGREIKTKAQVYWRRHYDRFELYREDKDYYVKDTNGYYITEAGDTAGLWYKNHNYHVTDIFGADVNLHFNSSIGKTSIGAGLRSENILSNSLGKLLSVPVAVEQTDSVYYTKQASRNNFELFAEQSYRNDFLFVSIGAMINWNSYTPEKFHFIPGVDINVKLIDGFSFIASYNSTIGTPTFTDLYYRDPTNLGNDKLKPYNQNSIEAGIKLRSKMFNLKGVVFYTNGKNNIEWIYDSAEVFIPYNVPLSENKGIELSLGYKSQDNSMIDRVITNFYIGYTYIDTYRDIPDTYSKYSNIRKKLVVNLQQQVVPNLLLSWNFMFKERTGYYLTYDFNNNVNVLNNYPDAMVLDLRISYTFKYIGLYIEGANLTDAKYYESGSIPQPGRWIRGGVSINISGKE